MARAQRSPFHPDVQYVTRKPFTFNGKDYKTGDVFDHEKEGAEERKLRNMFDGGFLMTPPEKGMKKTETKKTQLKVVKTEKAKTTEAPKKETKAEAQARRRKERKNKKG